MLQLILPSNNLDGPLPDLTGLVYLSTLLISNNIIQLPIPPLPTSLVELDLSSSIQLPADPQSGIIPDFSLLTRLTFLNISNNSLYPPEPHSHSPLPPNLQSLDLSNNVISNPDTGSIPRWLLPDQLGDQIVFVNLSLNYFCGFLGQDFIPPAASVQRLDLRNNSFFCPLPKFNSSSVSADCEPLNFSGISPTSGPTYNNQHDPRHEDSRLLRIFADGLSDYEECVSYQLQWRCRMSFVNSSQPESVVLSFYKTEDNCLVCRPLPDSGVGMLNVVIELLQQDGVRSSTDVPVGIWLPVFQTNVLYCQVLNEMASVTCPFLTILLSTRPLLFHPFLPRKLRYPRHHRILQCRQDSCS
jgi:hypothetical protein